MPPLSPALAELSPDFLMKSLHSMRIMRIARMDLPVPAPPQKSRMKLTSWKASKACVHSSSISRMSGPEMLAHRLKSVNKNVRHEPIEIGRAHV